MRLKEFNEVQLLAYVDEIDTNQKRSTVEYLSMSEYQMRSVSFAGTILDDLKAVGAYGDSHTTLGQLACHTGIPVATLYAVISTEDGAPESAIAACNKLREAITSLRQPVAA